MSVNDLPKQYWINNGHPHKLKHFASPKHNLNILTQTIASEIPLTHVILIHVFVYCLSNSFNVAWTRCSNTAVVVESILFFHLQQKAKTIASIKILITSSRAWCPKVCSMWGSGLLANNSAYSFTSCFSQIFKGRTFLESDRTNQSAIIFFLPCRKPKIIIDSY